MKILIVDGQGGGVGRQLAARIKEAFPDVSLTAVGTNTIATAAMLKGGADKLGLDLKVTHISELLAENLSDPAS